MLRFKWKLIVIRFDCRFGLRRHELPPGPGVDTAVCRPEVGRDKARPEGERKGEGARVFGQSAQTAQHSQERLLLQVRIRNSTFHLYTTQD